MWSTSTSRTCATRSTARSVERPYRPSAARAFGSAAMTPVLAPMQLSVRARTTAAFAAVMLMLFAGVAALAYTRMSAALLDELDTALRFRAVTALQQPPLARVLHPDWRLQEPGEAFEQLVLTDGTVASATAGFATPVLTAAEVAHIRSPTFLTRAVAGVEGHARLLAVPTR